MIACAGGHAAVDKGGQGVALLIRIPPADGLSKAGHAEHPATGLQCSRRLCTSVRCGGMGGPLLGEAQWRYASRSHHGLLPKKRRKQPKEGSRRNQRLGVGWSTVCRRSTGSGYPATGCSDGAECVSSCPVLAVSRAWRALGRRA